MKESTETKLEERVFMPTGRGDIFDLTPEKLEDFKKSVQDIFKGIKGILPMIDGYRLNEGNGLWTKINNEELTLKEIEPIDESDKYGNQFIRFKTWNPKIDSEYGVPIYMNQEPRFAFLKRKDGISPTKPRLGLYLSQPYTESIPNKWTTGREELIFL